MTVLCYIRPWNKKQFKIITKYAFPNQDVHFISDFPKHGPFYLQERIVRYLKVANKKQIIPTHLLQDIIARCRLLRNLDTKKAQALVHSCYQVINEIFDETKPDYIIGVTVDSYIIDVIHYVAKTRGKKYIGLVGLFINGYSRVTARGEANFCRHVPNEEVEEVYDRLVNQHEKPKFLNKLTSASHLKKTWRKNKFKNYLRLGYMVSKRLCSRNHWYCYHYWVSYMLMAKASEKINLSIFDELRLPLAKNSCYIPLQYFPECTVDYWVNDCKKIDYYTTLLEVVERLTKANIHVYIKEHPNALAIRPKGLYKKLKSIQGVSLVNPCVSSNELIIHTDFTLVWTGSAGMEAALLGKPVVHLGNPYYSTGDKCFIDWETFIKNQFALPHLNQSEHEKKNIIKEVLKSSINSDYYSSDLVYSDEENYLLAKKIGLALKESLII